MPGFPSLRSTVFVAALSVASAGATHAQAAAKPKHPVVCANGVQIYHERAKLPAQRDSLQMPDGPPIRVTSPNEEEAAERTLRERAGSVGATSLLFSSETVEDTNGRRTTRSVSAFFVPADSAKAQQACKK